MPADENSTIAANRPENGASDGAVRLLRLADLAAELENHRIEAEARDLAGRIAEGRFYVACIGQFKRGKSTLINVLIGDPVLPVGFTPITAIPTVVRFGKRRRARIQVQDGSSRDINVSDLGQYVSEECNPENVKGVRGAEVFVPSPLLAGGMCFVDTPGLGSVFTGNTAATQAFIPHIDAALVVIGAEPPLAGEELSLVESVGRQAQDLIIVLNKADRATAEERAAAASFAERQLVKRLGRQVDAVLQVSAVQQLEMRHQDQELQCDWQKLVASLQALVAKSGRQLIDSACERGITRLSEQLLAVIREEREALQRPIEVSELRIVAMKATIAQAEQSLRDLGYLFMAEQQRLSDFLVARHKAFVASVESRAREQLAEAIGPLRYGSGPAYRRRIMEKAQEITRLHLLPWLGPEQNEGEQRYRQVSRRFIDMGNEFLQKLADSGIPDLARMPNALDFETGFRVRSRFTFEDYKQVARPVSPLVWLGDFVLVAVGARSVITRRADALLQRMIEVNSTRVHSDILDRLQESRTRLEVEIRKLLHEVSRIAEQALANSKALRDQGAPVVDAALRKLDLLEQQVIDVAS
ncbi:MAG: dynamin family protein [Terriglobales bacterium]